MFDKKKQKRLSLLMRLAKMKEIEKISSLHEANQAEQKNSQLLNKLEQYRIGYNDLNNAVPEGELSTASAYFLRNGSQFIGQLNESIVVQQQALNFATENQKVANEEYKRAHAKTEQFEQLYETEQKLDQKDQEQRQEVEIQDIFNRRHF